MRCSIRKSIHGIICSILDRSDTTAHGMIMRFNTIGLDGARLNSVHLGNSSVTASTSRCASSTTFSTSMASCSVILRSTAPGRRRPMVPAVSIITNSDHRRVAIRHNKVTSTACVAIGTRSNTRHMCALGFSCRGSSGASLTGVLISSHPIRNFSTSGCHCRVGIASRISSIETIHNSTFRAIGIDSINSDAVVSIHTRSNSSTRCIVICGVRGSTITALNSVLDSNIRVTKFRDSEFSCRCSLPINIVALPRVSMISNSSNRDISVSGSGRDKLMAVRIISRSNSRDGSCQIRFVHRLSRGTSLDVVCISNTRLIIDSSECATSSTFSTSIHGCAVALPIKAHIGPVVA